MINSISLHKHDTNNLIVQLDEFFLKI